MFLSDPLAGLARWISGAGAFQIDNFAKISSFLSFFASGGLKYHFQTLGMHRDVFLAYYKKMIFFIFSNSKFCQGNFSFLLAWSENPAIRFTKGNPIVRIVAECPQIGDKYQKLP